VKLDLVRNPRKPLFFGYLLNLFLESRKVEFDGFSAGVADQVMVVFWCTYSVSGLAIS
jgi:hypothetical protein